jgi:Reeler domain
MMLSNIRITSFGGAVLLLFVSTIQSIHGYSTGAGSCNAGYTALGGFHIDDSAHQQTLNLTLSQLELDVKVGDMSYSANSRIVVVTNTVYTISLQTRTPDAFFRGALIRLETLTNQDMSGSFEPEENLGVVSSCPLPSVIGASHINNDMKTQASATFIMDKPGDIIMDITIVVANTAAISMFGYGTFTMEVVNELSPVSSVQGSLSPSPSNGFPPTKSLLPTYSLSPGPALAVTPTLPTTPAPVATTPAPVATTPAPVLGTPAPVLGTPAPVLSTPAPVLSTPAPILSTPAPVLSTPAPALLTPAPVLAPNTNAPVLSTPAPIPKIPTPESSSVRVPNYNPSQRVPETQRRRDRKQSQRKNSSSSIVRTQNLRNMDQ